MAKSVESLFTKYVPSEVKQLINQRKLNYLISKELDYSVLEGQLINEV